MCIIHNCAKLSKSGHIIMTPIERMVTLEKTGDWVQLWVISGQHMVNCTQVLQYHFIVLFYMTWGFM